MGIQLSGFNSGLPVDDIIAKLMEVERRPIQLMQERKAKYNLQRGIYSNVQSRVNDLLKAVETLTKRALDGSSIFDNKIGKSSDDTIATATATKDAAPQSLLLEVKSLPTATKATSTSLVGRFDNATQLSQLGITDGNFTIYSNGTAHTISVLATDTMGDVFAAINAAVPEITVDPTIVNGRVQIQYTDGSTIQLGSGGDTTNFLSKTHLLTGINDPATDTITASQVNTTIRLDQLVSAAAANLNTAVADGTFTINGVSFDTTGKSLNQIIGEINSNASVKVRASFNMGSNKLELTSTETGSSLISLGDNSNGGGTSNFLQAMGLISPLGDSTASQTAGKNTEFVLNGVTMYATSAVVDETVHGVTGVTLNLKQAAPGSAISIDIAKNKEGVKSAIKEMVNKINTVISYIDEQTNAEKKAPLASDSRLKSFRNQLRTMVTSQVAGLSGSAYDSLQQVGISTGAVGATSGTASATLIFDESKFDAAYDADPDTIRRLFIGQDLTGAQDGSAADDNMLGTVTRIWQLVDDAQFTTGGGGTAFGALYNGPGPNDKGLFPSYQTSIQKRIADIDESIDRAEERLLLREKTLRQQFLAMERMIGQMQAQGNSLNGLINQLTANNGK